MIDQPKVPSPNALVNIERTNHAFQPLEASNNISLENKEVCRSYAIIDLPEKVEDLTPEKTTEIISYLNTLGYEIDIVEDFKKAMNIISGIALSQEVMPNILTEHFNVDGKIKFNAAEILPTRDLISTGGVIFLNVPFELTLEDLNLEEVKKRADRIASDKQLGEGITQIAEVISRLNSDKDLILLLENHLKANNISTVSKELFDQLINNYKITYTYSDKDKEIFFGKDEVLSQDELLNRLNSKGKYTGNVKLVFKMLSGNIYRQPEGNIGAPMRANNSFTIPNIYNLQPSDSTLSSTELGLQFHVYNKKDALQSVGVLSMFIEGVTSIAIDPTWAFETPDNFKRIFIPNDLHIKRRLAHRDLHSGNILKDDKDNLTIIDWELSTILSAFESNFAKINIDIEQLTASIARDLEKSPLLLQIIKNSIEGRKMEYIDIIENYLNSLSINNLLPQESISRLETLFKTHFSFLY